MASWKISLAAPAVLGLGLALGSSPALALLECDRDGNDRIDVDEARFCAELEFDELRDEGQELGEDQFAGEGERIMPTFSEVDEDGDGMVTREEWMAFSDRRFAGATEMSEGQMTTEDYQSWRAQGMRP